MAETLLAYEEPVYPENWLSLAGCALRIRVLAWGK